MLLFKLFNSIADSLGIQQILKNIRMPFNRPTYIIVFFEYLHHTYCWTLLVIYTSINSTKDTLWPSKSEAMHPLLIPPAKRTSTGTFIGPGWSLQSWFPNRDKKSGTRTKGSATLKKLIGEHNQLYLARIKPKISYLTYIILTIHLHTTCDSGYDTFLLNWSVKNLLVPIGSINRD